MSEVGPIYNVPLIDSLPLGTGMMQQAMPSRQDLLRVQQLSQRVVAGYEVLLSHYQASQKRFAALEAKLQSITDSQFSRLEQMIEPGQQTWDLSPNDVDAIKAAVLALKCEEDS